MTPSGVEKWAGKKAWEWVKQYARRYAELEARVTALEKRLERQPPEACPYCGELAMRMSEPPHSMGDPGKKWIREYWKCGACTKEQRREYKMK